ncbi:type I-F CRISPR-associated protein Csy3 [Rheinheimera sp. UJ63]|uniref:type I-F CRISPR-associated protein Csy3 n=1 Tax=Rheinheimera sp. UJ63 TaxID=2910157 RepID=UPI001F179D79|nr:type I-F CRISPR-associated protein Csy3 [Rheinheimera sp. UJ63]MCF4010653.1 type I-F CRISPR-associated protein Csy3 [Rheinheimera sp. UJ63]
MVKPKKLTLPEVLSFSGRISPSEALFEGGRWEDRHDAGKFAPIMITQKTIRGTISNRLKENIANNPLKVDAEIQKANIQTIDAASLESHHNTLKMSFTVRFFNDVHEPTACNKSDYLKVMQSTISDYVTRTNMKELAIRYATNIANGRFLWRNRLNAGGIEINVTHKDKTWVFDGHEYSLDSFEKPTSDLESLADVIRGGLLADDFTLLKVVAYVEIGEGQTVYPSQEFVNDSSGPKKKKGDKTKFLHQKNGVAAVTSQKIGNAIRTIDTWYTNEHNPKPICVEVYGSVTTHGVAHRLSNINDFFTLFDGWILNNKVPDINQQHYVVAILIRGGVFGKSKGDKPE